MNASCSCAGDSVYGHERWCGTPEPITDLDVTRAGMVGEVADDNYITIRQSDGTVAQIYHDRDNLESWQ